MEVDLDQVEEAVRIALAENDTLGTYEIQRVAAHEVNRQIAAGLVSLGMDARVSDGQITIRSTIPPIHL